MITSATATSNSNTTWLIFTVMTMICWGSYAILMHSGIAGFLQSSQPTGARYKAFLFVGLAYFLVGVIAPVVMLLIQGASWDLFATRAGWSWSLAAGIAGAIGAFGVLLAFENKGNPAVVMSIVFGGAPIVNASIAITLDKAWGRVSVPFLIGIVLAAVGATMVTYYKPKPKPKAGHAVAPAAAVAVDTASETSNKTPDHD